MAACYANVLQPMCSCVMFSGPVFPHRCLPAHADALLIPSASRYSAAFPHRQHLVRRHATAALLLSAQLPRLLPQAAAAQEWMNFGVLNNSLRSSYRCTIFFPKYFQAFSNLVMTSGRFIYSILLEWMPILHSLLVLSIQTISEEYVVLLTCGWLWMHSYLADGFKDSQVMVLPW